MRVSTAKIHGLLGGVIAVAMSALALMPSFAFAALDSGNITTDHAYIQNGVSETITVTYHNTSDTAIFRIIEYFPSTCDVSSVTLGGNGYQNGGLGAGYLNVSANNGSLPVVAAGATYDMVFHCVGYNQVPSDNWTTVAYSQGNSSNHQAANVLLSIGVPPTPTPTPTPVVPLHGVVSGISGGVSPTSLLHNSAPVLGLLGVAVLVVFGLTLIGGAVSGLGKGKARISGGYGSGSSNGAVDGIKSGKYHD